jgi:GR25 family glycosyltransferase involved in LPS biosynthesis
MTSLPLTWQDLLSIPVFVVNLDRKPERWAAAQTRIAERGFKRMQRWRAADGVQDDLDAALQRHAAPGSGPLKKSPHDREFHTYPGKCGCLVSHMNIWRHIQDVQLPVAVVFEDDVLFHPEFDRLAPFYYEATPKRYDILYLGAQLDAPSAHHIDRVPVFCTHAYVITLAGARKAYELVRTHPAGVSTVDCMLIDAYKAHLYQGAPLPLEWYVWNGTFFPTSQAQMDKGWTKRNGGLVFQDETFGSDVRPW